MKRSIIASISVAVSLLFASFMSSQNPSFNPTGTYEYDHGDDGDGTVKVQQISKDKIKVSIFVIGGPPSHNMGEFMGDLKIKNNVAIYKSGDCELKFIFNSKAVKVIQSDWDCGFGMGVMADGYYKKTSSKVPDMEDPY